MRLSVLYEKRSRLDPNLNRQKHRLKGLPVDREIAWMGGDTQRGEKDQVKFTYKKGDPRLKGNFVYHNHPTRGKEPEPINTFPSQKDLESAQQLQRDGARGIGIFNDNSYYLSVVPGDKSSLEQSKLQKYKKSVKKDDPQAALDHLEDLGFDAEFGKL